jgi:glycosyltransferase involved in cell wall biosynthesis
MPSATPHPADDFARSARSEHRGATGLHSAPSPRVSVVIPAHNAVRHLAETLDSVIAQTYGDWEAIVADDASSDATAELAAGYHPQIACVRSERNLGPAGARNLALSHARGELVALLDADDRWLPHYLERQLDRYDAARASGANVGIVCCDAYELGPEGQRERTYAQRAGWVDEVTLTSLLRSNTIYVSALAPRAAIEEVGGFSTECFGTEDFDLWLRLLESGRSVVATREPLALYRRVDGSVSANVAGMSRATQTAYRRALARGHLTIHQRLIARRELRLQRLVEAWEEFAAERRSAGQIPWRTGLRALPLALRVGVERPGRWPRWLALATAPRRPSAGADRHRPGD